VFLAGGIGITPFVSMIRVATERSDQRHFHLFYSNRRPRDAAFLDELGAVATRNNRFHLVATMTGAELSAGSWGGERGFVDAAMLGRHLPALNGPIYYVAGPPRMVEAMRAMLVTAGVDEDDIRAEDFGGY
jgi:ferredoxin-NADP reductase